MNFVGHLEVAVRCELGARGGLGAMLPDLAPMLGTRVDRDRLPPTVVTGVALHHATDGVFHGDPFVRASMATISEALLDAGFARGAARALGHVGFEMLLDASAHRGIGNLAPALAAGDDPSVAGVLGVRDGWRTLRSRFTAHPPRYDDPEWVAERLFHILDRRPRLRFERAAVPALAAALASVAPTVHAAAPALFTAVAAAVAEPRTGE